MVKEGERNMPDFTQVWWVLDPRDEYGCCPSCQKKAANSPYTRPGSGENELQRTPGGSSTECGTGCTCRLSYEPPEQYQWPPDEMLSDYEQAIRKVSFTEREAVYIEHMKRRHQVRARFLREQ
jgi:hypothetical protein